MAGVHNVIKEGRYRQFCLLMKLGIDVNYSSPEDGLVPLMRCCCIENDRYAGLMTKALLDHGANKTSTDRLHRNCLVHAVLTDRMPIMKLLLEVIDFDVNQVDDFGNTLLHHVAFHSGEVMTRLILSRLPLNRTNVDKVNTDGLTPLMCASVNGNLEAAQVLVNEGNASLTVRDNRCFRNALEWLRSSIFVPKTVNPFSYGYKPQDGKFIEIDGSALKLNLPPYLAMKRSKTILTSTLGVVNQKITPVVRHRSLSAPARKDRLGSSVKRDGSITSPSMDDLSDMRSAESRIRLMRDRYRYNHTQLLRQMFMKYETQLCPAYRPSAAPLVAVTVDDCESEDSFCSSSQASIGHSSQTSGRFKKAEVMVESAMFNKNKMNRRPSRVSSRASSMSRIGKQSSTDSTGTMSGSLSSSASSDKFRDKMRKTQSKLVAKRAISQPALSGDGGGRGSGKEWAGSMTALPTITGSPADGVGK
jgi:ankyrin repeat protein